MPRLFRSRRRRAVKLMAAHLEITRADTSQRDPITGESRRAAIYDGPGKIQTYEPHETAHQVGGGTVVTQRYAVHVPVSAGPFEIGDLVYVVESPTMPHAVGDVFRVAGLHEETHQTAQRLLVDHNSSSLSRREVPHGEHYR